MRKLAVVIGMTVLGGLVGCAKVTEFRMDMEAAQFRQECFANNTYDCVNRRVNFNEKLIDIAKKHWEDAHDQAVQQIGEQRFQIVLKTFDKEYAQQEKDRPFFFMRWFFGDHQVPYGVSNLLFDDGDLERILAEALHTAKTTPGLEPLPKQGGASNPASASTASLEDKLTKALETPVNVGPAVSASVAKVPASAPMTTTAGQSATAPLAPISPTLAKLFVPDAIQGNVAWVESMTGPAHQVLDNGNGTQNRVYQVDGCKVTALASNQTINELTLDLAPNCNVSLRSMVASAPDVTANGLTFGDLFKDGAEDIALQCAGPDECGNSADPSIQATLGGSHADDFKQVVFNGIIAENADVDALQDLMKAESAHTGKADLDLDAKVYNQDPQFPGLVQKKMGGVKVTSITFKSSM